jgi:uncharacterized protein
MIMDLTVKHEKEYQQFTVKLEDEKEAELAYAMPEQDTIDFTHTYVPKTARGQGIAQQMIEEGLCFARDNGYLVIATCPAVKKYIHSNPEHQHLLK